MAFKHFNIQGSRKYYYPHSRMPLDTVTISGFTVGNKYLAFAPGGDERGKMVLTGGANITVKAGDYIEFSATATSITCNYTPYLVAFQIVDGIYKLPNYWTDATSVSTASETAELLNAQASQSFGTDKGSFVFKVNAFREHGSGVDFFQLAGAAGAFNNGVRLVTSGAYQGTTIGLRLYDGSTPNTPNVQKNITFPNGIDMTKQEVIFGFSWKPGSFLMSVNGITVAKEAFGLGAIDAARFLTANAGTFELTNPVKPYPVNFTEAELNSLTDNS